MRRVTLHKKWFWLAGILVVLVVPASLLAFRALNPPQGTPCGKDANATGVIDSVVKESGIVRLYDPARKILPPGMGRVSLVIKVESSTRIFRQPGATCQALQPASFSDLRPGQTLKIWSSSGTMLETYPEQLLDISNIVIMP